MSRALGFALVACVTASLASAPGRASAQSVRLAPDAEVRSIHFRFVGEHALEAEDLSDALATKAPSSLTALHRAVAWIPFVPDPPKFRLDPPTLQSDVVRLRRLYRREGFLEAQVDYDLDVDADRRKVGVTFVVSEGRPLALRSSSSVNPQGGADLGLPDSLARRLEAARETVGRTYIGKRFREAQVASIRTLLLASLGNSGYAFASIEPRAAIDSLARQVDLVWVVELGPRVRVASIEVQGARSVPKRIVTRQIPVVPGDWVSQKEIDEGRRNLQSVDLFRRSDVSLQGKATADSALPITVKVTESRPRLTNLELGYVTDGAGVTAQARWTHPNFTGGARSLDVLWLVQTGWGNTEGIPDKLNRVALTLTQPYVGSPLLSLGIGPAAELRDGRIDHSRSLSALATLVYRLNSLQSAALRYDYTYRKLEEVRILGLPAGDVIDPSTLKSAGSEFLEALKVPVRTSQFIFFTSLGGLDDIARPRRGVVLKPNLSVTFPKAWGNAEFARADLQATFFTPFPGKANALMLRGTLGGLWPFGQSIPTPGEAPIIEWIRIGDQVLTAGGATDVRGYPSQLLGPKFPDVEAKVVGPDTVLSADHYVPLGGLRRFTASGELRLGMPWISRNVFAHLFADMGRVWTTDPRLTISPIAESDQRAHYTTGGGVGYYTPVGAIRFDVGYKLNPSVYDLRRPNDVLTVLLAGQAAASAPIDEWMRVAFHLSLGLYF